MAGEDKHSKKHPASDHKKRQLKKKGQVPKSTDVPMAAGLVAAFGTLIALKNFYMGRMSGIMNEYYSELPRIGHGHADIGSLIMRAARDIMFLSLPLLCAVLVIAVISNIAQTGLIIASEPLKPNLNKINPMSKFKQWFSVKSLQELMKSLVKILLAGFVGWLAWKGAISAIAESVLFHPDGPLGIVTRTNAIGLMNLGGSIIKGMFLKVIILYVIIAAIDYGFQRRNFLNEHKMTDKEVKDEYKQQEGDPYMKGKRRQMAYQIAMQGSQENVPQGDVTVVNPTELAIVLKYDPDVSPVPYVIAKGEKRHADEIREASGKAGVPVVRNKPLARALFELCEIGDVVPADLFKPVAEILAYVFALADQEAGPAAAATQPAQADAQAAATQTLAPGADGVHDLGSVPVPMLQPAGVGAEGAGWMHAPVHPSLDVAGARAAAPHHSLVPTAHWSPLTGAAAPPAPDSPATPASPFSWQDTPPAW